MATPADMAKCGGPLRERAEHGTYPGAVLLAHFKGSVLDATSHRSGRGRTSDATRHSTGGLAASFEAGGERGQPA
ncbi:MAG TPA: hypothetical protein VJV79_27880 [Polyangiaceae bacterium]|nr:hypothetical protein [Polyangiaceae bacterium]